ncbi:hypothetical protein COT12_00135 [Candidatus Berkelbacteria bacterium CG08_land_8_20_14_0_20_39_8]|uniref:Glycosyltransferase RgtA/B/C/D-like domain-containing protein n=1 Tax=Candidatus Berkelbacteria bacterium CG08_land_8_20_14_0_20_39_8 TaxID=1974511 RepID=A0A2M6YD46_9BACT|nr:MAG: hypothetical protein COT12_00135 [Candidatus Berkelbacteria bacterium CG08_land_8_20_14_0_20_39_8]
MEIVNNEKMAEEKNNQVRFIEGRKIAPIFILGGLFIRFLLMPLSTHNDLLSSIRRQSLFIFNHFFNVGKFSEVILIPYLWLIKPLISKLPDALQLSNIQQSSVSFAELQNFLLSANALNYLFLFKAPYLIFDLLFLVVIFKYFSQNRKTRNYAIAFWAFNPLILYSVYLWGRYEIIPISLLALSFLLASRKQPVLTILIAGLAVATRVSFILFLPLLIIYFSKNYKDYIINSLFAVLPLAIISRFISLGGASSIVSSASSADFGQFFLSMKIGNDFSLASIFVLAYPVLLYIYYRLKREANFNQLLKFLFLASVAYFLFGYFNPHYLVWMTPMLIFILPERPKFFWYFILLVIFYLLFIESFWGTAVSWQLFIPANQSFFLSVGGIYQQPPILSFGLPSARILVRSLFDLSLIFIAYKIYFNFDEKKSE